MREFYSPEPVRVDAYQAGHFELIPTGMENFEVSQGIYRKPMWPDDHRIVSAGMAPFLKLNMEHDAIRKHDVTDAEEFYNDFYIGKPYPFPKEMFMRIVKEFHGFMPIVITALMDGTTHYVGEPHVQVWTDEPGMAELVGWIESTMLPYLVASSIVATKGRKRKELMMDVFKSCYPSKTTDEIHAMIQYKFHDFGRRGGPASQITGIAHLINWLGTDTVDAAYAATMYLNNRKKFGACSIMAAAHRTITPWPTEDEAYAHMVKKFSGNFFSIVADSYEYYGGMRKLGRYAEVIKRDNGFLVGRPDSGDPVECVVEGLRIFDDAFGHTLQEKGLRVLKNSGILQGDGVNDDTIFNKIYPAVIKAGYCPSNVAFGMGEHNHAAVRSQTEEGYKTCMVGIEGGFRPVMKGSNSQFKMSLPCPVSIQSVKRHPIGPRVFPINIDQLRVGATGDLIVQYNGRPKSLSTLATHSEAFETTRKRAYESWLRLEPKPDDTFHSDIRKMQKEYMAKMLK